MNQITIGSDRIPRLVTGMGLAGPTNLLIGQGI